MREIIDRKTAQMLCRLFDRMYKLGVNDAANAEDEGLVRMWIEKTTQPGVFGRLDDETSHEAMYWQLTIQKIAFSAGVSKRLMWYASCMGRYGSNYFSTGWVVFQCFYNLGMQDYINDPTARTLEAFNSKLRQRWIKGGGDWNTPSIVSQAQEFCFKRNHSDQHSSDRKALKPNHYTMFIKAIGLAALKTL